jgi:hypothetical protein
MKTKKQLLIIIGFAMSFMNNNFAQGVVITDRDITPHPSAILEMQSSSKGVLIPRVTFLQRMHIQTDVDATGLLVFQTDREVGFYYFDGFEWKYFAPPVTTELPDFAKVAISGSYHDLNDKPTIISNLRQMQQDQQWAMYVSKAEKDAWNEMAEIAGAVTDSTSNDTVPVKISISWNALADRPFIPTHLKDLIPDALYFLTVSKAEKDAWNASSNFSGRWADLQGKPFIPTHLIDLIPDYLYFMTVSKAEKDTWNTKSNFSGTWIDLQGKPFIPTRLRDLTQDSLYYMTVTKQQIDKWDGTVRVNNFSGQWTDLEDKPDFATVATSGNYLHLQNRPYVPRFLDDHEQHNWAMWVTRAEKDEWNNKSGFSGYWQDLNGKPNFHIVATSGDYNDLENKLFVPTTMDHINDGLQYVRLTEADRININNALESLPTMEKPLPIEKGGTGANTALEARKNLGLGDGNLPEKYIHTRNVETIKEIYVDSLGRVIDITVGEIMVGAESIGGMALGANYQIGVVSPGQSKVNIQNWISHPVSASNNNEIASTKFVRDAIDRIGGTGDVISTGYNSSTNYSELKIRNDVILEGTPSLNNPNYGSNFASQDYIATTRFLMERINTLRQAAINSRTITVKNALNEVMPIGAIIMRNEAGSPDGLTGSASCWERVDAMQGRFPVGAGSYSLSGDVSATYAAGQTFDNLNRTGRNQVALTTAQMPSHAHTLSGTTIGSGGSSARAAGSGNSVQSGLTGGTASMSEGESSPHENRPPFYAVEFWRFKGCP